MKRIIIFIVVGILVLLGIYFMCDLTEGFDFNLSKYQQANKDITRSQEDLNNKLDNTLGDVLVEWDFQDTGDLLNSGQLEGIALHTLKCSRSCCPSQWPLPKELRDNGDMCGRDLVRSNYTCANGSGSGCVCLPKSHYEMIARRGNNATLY